MEPHNWIKFSTIPRTLNLPIAGGRTIGFIPFPRVLVLCEMQSVSSRIWTRVAVSISYDNNHYTTGTGSSESVMRVYCKIESHLNMFVFVHWFLTDSTCYCAGFVHCSGNCTVLLPQPKLTILSDFLTSSCFVHISCFTVISSYQQRPCYVELPVTVHLPAPNTRVIPLPIR